MPTARRTTSVRLSTGGTKARRGATARKRAAVKSKVRQHYSELGTRKASRSAKPRLAASTKVMIAKKRKVKARRKPRSEITPATRELFSDLAKVGRKIKRRVKRAL